MKSPRFSLFFTIKPQTYVESRQLEVESKVQPVSEAAAADSIFQQKRDYLEFPLTRNTDNHSLVDFLVPRLLCINVNFGVQAL